MTFLFWTLIAACTFAAINGAEVARGTCYSAMHNSEYYDAKKGKPGLAQAIDADFEQLSLYFKYVRTFYSNFSGYTVARSAAKYGVKLYLGAFMTKDKWYKDQLSAAVDAVKQHPETVEAILVGNENLKPNGDFTADEIIAKVVELRSAVLNATGRNVKVGTVQRITEWTSNEIEAETLKLSKACDILGVNIYPFYSTGYKASQPTKQLDSMWNKMMDKYGPEKVRLTETGWPSEGTDGPSSGNVPSLDNALNYYNGFIKWTRGQGPMFWYSFYDRHPNDTSMGFEYKKHFGFATYLRKMKANNYPLSIV